MESKPFSVLVLVVVALACVLVVYGFSDYRAAAPSPSATTIDGWLTYSDPDVGVSFRYPPEWGTVSNRLKVSKGPIVGETISAGFSNNPTIFLNIQEKYFVNLDDVDVQNLKDSCLKPRTLKIMSDDEKMPEGYCRLYENEGRYLYEGVVAYDSSRQSRYEDVLQRAVLSLDHQSYKQFELTQFIDNINPKSILDRTADPAILQKIDTFEKVMLTLEVK